MKLLILPLSPTISMVESICDFRDTSIKVSVCQSGQLQRLMVGVVQGRIPEVNIDGVDFETKKNGDESLSLFFENKENRTIEDPENMSDVARTFIQESPNIDAAAFKEALTSFWKSQGYDGELRLD